MINEKGFTFSQELKMTTKAELNLHHQQMLKIYQANGLRCLSDNQFKYNGVNTFAVPDSGFQDPLWSSYKNLRDIINCNQDLMYFTGNLFLYAPFINNPLEDVDTQTFDFPVSHYHQNWYDHRYCAFVSCCFEKAYNYWDRIGDLLYSFFPSLLPSIRAVDFPRIVDAIANLGENDPDFVWLRNFKCNQYADLNRFRRDVVHYYQYETTFHAAHATNCTKLDEIAKLWEEKKSLPQYFKNHLELALEGCVRSYAYLFKVETFRANNPNAQAIAIHS
jgi:hypothetical protein